MYQIFVKVGCQVFRTEQCQAPSTLILQKSILFDHVKQESRNKQDIYIYIYIYIYISIYIYQDIYIKNRIGHEY